MAGYHSWETELLDYLDVLRLLGIEDYEPLPRQACIYLKTWRKEHPARCDVGGVLPLELGKPPRAYGTWGAQPPTVPPTRKSELIDSARAIPLHDASSPRRYNSTQIRGTCRIARPTAQITFVSEPS